MNRIIGSMLIVAGTTIGAGMLAMPIISAKVGFGVMSLILIIIWIAMCYTSILLVDVYKYNSPSDGLNTLTYKYLGRNGSVITAISMLTLMYALVSAYITGGGDILRTSLNQWLDIDIDSKSSGLIFAFLFGGIICLGTRIVDASTKIVFTVKLIFLFFVIVFLAPHIRLENLQSLPSNSLIVLSTIPIIFTSFGFYVVIPSLVQYLDGNSKKLKFVFITGSALPLLIYLVWELVVLGSVDNAKFASIIQENSGLEGLLLAIRKLQESESIRVAINVFATAAILTSFWGVALSLYDYIKDLAKNKPKIRNSFSAMFLTFLPPLGFALYYPDGFIMALGYASISLVILALIMPMLMLQKAQKNEGVKAKLSQKIIFALLWILSFLIIILQILMATRVIPSM